MEKSRIKQVFIVAFVLCMSANALAQDAPTGGTADGGVDLQALYAETVSLDISGGTVSDALLAVSKQADIPLAVSADQVALQQNFTLIVNDKSAGEVLEIISATTPLDFKLKNGVLIVQSKQGVPKPISASSQDVVDESDRHPGFSRFKKKFEHTRFWKKRKKRVELGRPVTVGKDEHLHTAVSLGDNTVIEGHIDKEAVAFGGNVTIKSGAVVEGSVVAIGGNVIVESGAVVGEDAVAFGGTVDVAEDAVLEGDRVSIGVPLPPMTSVAGAIGGMLVINLIGAVARSLFFFAVALLLFWLIPKRVDAVKGYMRQKPGVSILSGFLIFLAIIPLFIVLAITLVGIPLIPVALLAIAAMVFLGLTSCMVWLGERTPLFKNGRTPLKILIIGFVAFMVLNMVPVLGCLFMAACVLLGVGAAFQSRLGNRTVE